jgi:hypothetical protein
LLQNPPLCRQQGVFHRPSRVYGYDDRLVHVTFAHKSTVGELTKHFGILKFGIVG